MAVLTTKKRNKLPESKFALPSERKYPMPDAAHAKNAKARASMMVNKGMMSESTAKRIDAKANKVIKKGAKRK